MHAYLKTIGFSKIKTKMELSRFRRCCSRIWAVWKLWYRSINRKKYVETDLRMP